jgi:cytochrome c oxidase subunit 4
MRTYVLVLAALLVLTAVTVAASGIHFGSPAVNVIVALGIASLKASLVALFFMHLLHDKPLNALIFVSGLVFLAIFLILTLIDVDFRLPADVPPSAFLLRHVVTYLG